MRTFEWLDPKSDPENPTVYRIHYNSDLSGEAEINGSDPEDPVIRLPAALLAAFSRQMTINEIISKLEQI